MGAPARSSDAAVKNSRKHGARLRDLGEGARYQISDDVCGTGSLPRYNSGFWSVYRRQNLAFGGAKGRMRDRMRPRDDE